MYTSFASQNAVNLQSLLTPNRTRPFNMYTIPITLSQAQRNLYDTCTSGRKKCVPSVVLEGGHATRTRLHRAVVHSPGSARARCHVTFTPPRTYTALPLLRQSGRNAPHPKVHSAESSFFFFLSLFSRNVSSCPIYMISVFVAKPWQVAVSLQRRIMMRRARARSRMAHNER